MKLHENRVLTDGLEFVFSLSLLNSLDWFYVSIVDKTYPFHTIGSHLHRTHVDMVIFLLDSCSYTHKGKHAWKPVLRKSV